ncbi:SH3 domain-containing protein [Kribbella sp. NBC_01245]|uniref:SH3 domain-containing protein n=1 Tax=Kribbella sp. NBC_01245 TaxID=2903578 RepID=UPI002E2B7A66|nr:SH3 domain-containing protein [Kribbella sp. NBC_01245]
MNRSKSLQNKATRRSLRGAAVLAAATALCATIGGAANAVTIAEPANAASAVATSWIGSNSGGANMRTCPNTGCARVLYLGNGSEVYMLCWTDAQTVSPPNSDYTSSRWFKIGLYYDNRTGYVHSSLVENQSSVGHC